MKVPRKPNHMDRPKANHNDRPSTHEVRTVEVVIDLSGVGEGKSSLKISKVPVPVTFDYLAAQLASQPNLSSPRAFATENQLVKVEVVQGPSDFDLATMTGHINIDQPPCQYYSKLYIRAIEPGCKDTSDIPANVSVSRVNSSKTAVDVGSAHISFMRTLRVPDDDKTYTLPAGLGEFPLYNVSDFADRLPASLLNKGGLLVPMHQCEAMWMDFNGGVGNDSKPCAVKVSAGGINALTGLAQDKSSDGRQDYMPLTDRACGGQLWLDGFSTSQGVVRQFVAVPLGQGLTVESQLSGKETSSSLQVDVFPAWKTPKAFKCGYTTLDNYRTPRQQQLSVGSIVQWPEERRSDCVLTKDGESGKNPCIVNPPKHVRTLHLSAHKETEAGRIYVKTFTGEIMVISISIDDTIQTVKYIVEDISGIQAYDQRLIFGGTRLSDERTLSDYNITYGATLYLMIRLVGGGYPLHARVQGFGAGGKIAQKIVRDTLPASAYDFDSGVRLHVTIVDPQLLATLIGQPSISTPISVEAYQEAGIPWFDFYEEGVPAANNIARSNHALANVKSVQQILGKRRAEEPKKFQCSYCATTASYEFHPCGHLICADCADGMAESECPKRCKNVKSRTQIPAAALAETEAGHRLPEAGSSDSQIIALKRCAARGAVGTFIYAEHKVSCLSYGTV